MGFSENGLFCHGGILSDIGLASVGQLFLPTWIAILTVTILAVTVTSGPLFYLYYWPSQVTYEKWRMKSNPVFPSATKVRDEIVQMLKGVTCAALCPAASVWLANQNEGFLGIKSKAYCGSESPIGAGWAGVAYHLGTFVVVGLISDFWEFYYHYLGHKTQILWQQHRHHHKFFNPSPFAVIADEFIDQFFRALPLFLFPLALPINIDLMFFQYGVFFYAYGCYLHWGYELNYPDAHHPVLNTAFQHYCHHARGTNGKPYHCGFFFKLWDNLFDAAYDGECFCAKCERAAGKRTKEQFAKIEVPDYSVLLKANFWFNKDILSGATAKDKNFYVQDENAQEVAAKASKTVHEVKNTSPVTRRVNAH